MQNHCRLANRYDKGMRPKHSLTIPWVYCEASRLLQTLLMLESLWWYCSRSAKLAIQTTQLALRILVRKFQFSPGIGRWFLWFLSFCLRERRAHTTVWRTYLPIAWRFFPCCAFDPAWSARPFPPPKEFNVDSQYCYIQKHASSFKLALNELFSAWNTLETFW